MSNTTIPTDLLHRAVRALSIDPAFRALIADIKEHMPTPTLEEEPFRSEHVGMQAELSISGATTILVTIRDMTNPPGSGGTMIRVQHDSGRIYDVAPNRVTPRPDLPRMVLVPSGQSGRVGEEVTTIEALATLPVGTVVMDGDPNCPDMWIKRKDRPIDYSLAPAYRSNWHRVGTDHTHTSRELWDGCDKTITIVRVGEEATTTIEGR